MGLFFNKSNKAKKVVINENSRCCECSKIYKKNTGIFFAPSIS